MQTTIYPTFTEFVHNHYGFDYNKKVKQVFKDEISPIYENTTLPLEKTIVRSMSFWHDHQWEHIDYFEPGMKLGEWVFHEIPCLTVQTDSDRNIKLESIELKKKSNKKSGFAGHHFLHIGFQVKSESMKDLTAEEINIFNNVLSCYNRILKKQVLMNPGLMYNTADYQIASLGDSVSYGIRHFEM